MTIVIADDITGAAELAGIAYRHGLRTRLLTERETSLPVGDVLVVGTATRSMTEEEAVTELSLWLSWLLKNGITRETALFFKKTDSALRGHVVAELRAMMGQLDFAQSWYAPANPSKKRTVRHGIYRIDGVPLSDTDFAFDPEFPAHTASLAERFPEACSYGILMPDAESAETMESLVMTCPRHTLLAGAADLFEALLRLTQPQGAPPSCGHFSPPTTWLVVCGSTQSHPPRIPWAAPETHPTIEASPSYLAEMPIEVYEGKKDAKDWASDLVPRYLSMPGLVVAIPHTHLTGRATALRLRETMAAVVRELVDARRPEHLFIEGGATAFCCLQALNWHLFDITDVLAPGVVTMTTPSATKVTLKPGSYPWGGLRFEV